MNGDPSELVGRTLGQRYRLERVIGAGGMGAVYEATQIDLGRAVAVKVLIDVDPRGIARLRQEAFAAGSSSCPHVISIFDFQTPPGEPPFIVMELLPGHSLAKLLERERSLPVPRAVRIAVQILIALEAAHRADVVHRDIKPSNVWLVHGPGVEEHVKVLDFGIAKILGDGPSLRTTTGSILGTPSYLSPEQLEALPVDARTDIHAVGIVLYEMLAGRRPWNPRAHVYAEIRDRIPAPLTEVAPHVPPALSQIVARALAKDPPGRFARAADMRAAIEPFAGQAVASPATALGVGLGTTTVGSDPGGWGPAYAAPTRDERVGRGAPPATTPMGGASPLGTVPPTVGPTGALTGGAQATGSAVPPAYGTVPHQAPAAAYGVAPTLASTSASMPPQPPYAAAPLTHPSPVRSSSLALPFILGGGITLLVGVAAAAAFLIGHDRGSGGRTGVRSAPAPGSAAIAGDAGGAAPATSADAGARANVGGAGASTVDGRKATGGARAGGAVGAVAPATNTAQAASPDAAAAAGPISQRCECENRLGGLICTTTKVPNCGCHKLHSRGEAICPVAFNAKGDCPVRAPGDLLPYSAPGKKDGDSCSGINREGKPETGVLDCQPCYGRDKFAAVEGTPCSGIQMNGFPNEGKWVCEK